MNCRSAIRAISIAMDGELPASRRAVLDRHLAACPACRDVLDAWQAAREGVQTPVPAAPPVEPFLADVRRAIRLAEEEKPAVLLWRPRLAWAGAGLSMAAMLVVGLVFLQAVRAPPVAAGSVEWAEAELPGTSTMVYEDVASDTVIIWLMADSSSAPGGS